MNYTKTLIFDFDGTIADTLTHIIAIANDYVKEYGINKITKKDLERLKGKTPWQIMREYKIPLYKVPFIVVKVQSLLHKQMNKVKIFPGIKVILKTLKKKNMSIGILSSNSKKNVMAFLKKNNMNMFDFIHSENNLFGKDKALRNILRRYKIKKEDVIYIGDEVRDIEACKKAKIPVISVSWGFNTYSLLKKYKPDYIIREPKELLRIVE